MGKYLRFVSTYLQWKIICVSIHYYFVEWKLCQGKIVGRYVLDMAMSVSPRWRLVTTACKGQTLWYKSHSCEILFLQEIHSNFLLMFLWWYLMIAICVDEGEMIRSLFQGHIIVIVSWKAWRGCYCDDSETLWYALINLSYLY